IVVADNAAEPLTEAASDATNAKILFLLLGIPGALAAAALGLAAQSALASAQAAVSGLAGFALGLLAAFGAVSVVEGNLAWRGVPGGSLAAAIAAGLAIAAVTTAARLLVLVRTSRRVEVVAERRML